MNEPPRLWDAEGDALMRALLSAALDEVAPSAVRERAHEVVGSVLARGAFEVNTVSGVFDTGAGQGDGMGPDAGACDGGNGAVEPMVRDTVPLLPLLPLPGVPANDPSRARARARRAGMKLAGLALPGIDLAAFARRIAAAAQESGVGRRLSGVAQLAAAVAIGVAGAHVAHFARTSTLDTCSARAAVADVTCPAACAGVAISTALSAAAASEPRGIEPAAVAASVAGQREPSRSAGDVAEQRGGTFSRRQGGVETDDWLGEQLSLIGRAEHRLRAGDEAGTLRALDEYAHRYPRGLLDPQVAQLRGRAVASNRHRP